MARQYRRVLYRSAEWHELKEENWITVCVNSDNIALMMKVTGEE